MRRSAIPHVVKALAESLCADAAEANDRNKGRAPTRVRSLDANLPHLSVRETKPREKDA